MKNIAYNNIIYGELKTENEPFDGDLDLKNITHKVFNLVIANGKLYGDVEFLDTPKCKIINDVIDCSFSFKTRGELNNIIAIDCYLTLPGRSMDQT